MMPKLFLALSFILITSRGYSNDVLLTTKNPSMKFFELKQACLTMGYANTLLASGVGLSRVDCMGTKILASDFCRKQFPDHSKLLRGVITPDRKLACHFATSAILTVACERFAHFCKDATKGCQSLAPYYASNLMLDHSAISSRNDGSYLQCYFSEKDFIPDEEGISFAPETLSE